MLGYIDSLARAGVRTVLFLVSGRVKVPIRHTHAATGTIICVLPSLRSYRSLFRRVEHLQESCAEGASGSVSKGGAALSRIGAGLAPYFTTPLRLLAKELRREGCRAILCQEYEYGRFDMCLLLGRLIHIPVFATFQGGDFQRSCLEQPVRLLTIPACAGLIIGSKTEVRRVQSRYAIPSDRISRIFNPIDCNAWQGGDRHSTREALQIAASAQVVAWHGRIDIYRKGLDILLAAWDKICRDRRARDLRLVIIGSGRDAGILRQRIAAMQSKAVLWIDRYLTDVSCLRNYLAAADLYAFPSRHEGFPVAPLEAMACGLPLVAAAAPGIPDILEGGGVSGGVMVARDDATALALAIGRILDDEPYRLELAERARDRIQAKFSLEAIGKQLRDLLLGRTP